VIDEAYMNNSIHNSTVDIHHIFYILEAPSFLNCWWWIHQLILLAARNSVSF